MPGYKCKHQTSVMHCLFMQHFIIITCVLQAQLLLIYLYNINIILIRYGLTHIGI